MRLTSFLQAAELRPPKHAREGALFKGDGTPRPSPRSSARLDNGRDDGRDGGRDDGRDSGPPAPARPPRERAAQDGDRG